MLAEAHGHRKDHRPHVGDRNLQCDVLPDVGQLHADDVAGPHALRGEAALEPAHPFEELPECDLATVPDGGGMRTASSVPLQIAHGVVRPRQLSNPVRRERQRHVGERKRVRDGVCDSRGSADRPALTGALGAQLVDGRRSDEVRDLDRRCLADAGDQVIEEGAGQQLPVRAIRDLFHQRRADPLRHTAHHLPFDDGRVDQDAAILRHHVTEDLDRSGLAVDLGHADVRRVRVRRLAGVISRRNVKDVLTVIALGKLRQRHARLTVDQHRRTVDRESLSRLVEPVRRCVEDRLTKQRRRTVGARRRGDRAATHERSCPVANGRGVGLLDHHALGRDADSGSRNLRERRVRPLSDRGARRLEVNAAVAGEPHARRISARDVRHAPTLEGRRPGARVLDVGADAYADQAAFMARF